MVFGEEIEIECNRDPMVVGSSDLVRRFISTESRK